MKRILLCLPILVVLMAIFNGGGFVHDEKITGDYRLIACDISEQMSVDYGLPDGCGIGRIGETVFALDMTRDRAYADPKLSVTGPLTTDEFNEHSARLKLPAFTRVLRNLE